MQTRIHRVRAVRDLGGDCHALEVDGLVPATLPGQFYMLRTEQRWPVLLPRPFSLFDRAADGSHGAFLVKAVGPGTRALAIFGRREPPAPMSENGEPAPGPPRRVSP